MTRGLNRKASATPGRHGDIEIHWLGRNARNRAVLTQERSADDARLRSVIILDDRNLTRFVFLITWRGHLERSWKVRPQLKTVHAAGGIPLWHFLMNDPAARGHPLHV